MGETDPEAVSTGALSALRRSLLRWRYGIGTTIRMHPSLYLPMARWRHRGVPFGPDTELVIEAFPRSGNTFATAAFDLSQSRPVRVAHHGHAAAQVIAAVRAGVPALVLVRNPEDAIPSFVIQQPQVAIRQALRAYVRFHSSLLPHRHGFVVATFEDVTTDFGAVVRKVNGRFGTSFDEFVHTEDNVQRCFDAMGEDNRRRWSGRTLERKGAVPSTWRSGEKEALRAELLSEAHAGPCRRALDLYERFVALAAE